MKQFCFLSMPLIEIIMFLSIFISMYSANKISFPFLTAYPLFNSQKYRKISIRTYHYLPITIGRNDGFYASSLKMVEHPINTPLKELVMYDEQLNHISHIVSIKRKYLQLSKHSCNIKRFFNQSTSISTQTAPTL